MAILPVDHEHVAITESCIQLSQTEHHLVAIGPGDANELGHFVPTQLLVHGCT